MRFSSTGTVTSRLHRQRGIATGLVIYSLAAFSTLAMTLLTEPSLERTFQIDHPDLHVVLFTGAGPERLIGRLNLPVVRHEDEKTRPDVEVQVPSPVSADLNSAFQPGVAYAVQLSPDTRVCCDIGDGACARLDAQQELAQGSVNREIPPALGSAERTLKFDLSTFQHADNLQLDPSLQDVRGFLVKAARESAEAAADTLDQEPIMCRLTSKGKTVATGQLALHPTEPSRTSGPFAGKLQLTYSPRVGEASAKPAN